MVPYFPRDDVWTPVGIYPDENRDRSDGLRGFYRTIIPWL
jgi:hypothetical protein